MTDPRVSQEDRDNSPDNESLMGTIQLCRDAVFDGEPDGSGDYGQVCSNRKVIELCESVIALRGKLATVRAAEIRGATWALESATYWVDGDNLVRDATRIVDERRKGERT